MTEYMTIFWWKLVLYLRKNVFDFPPTTHLNPGSLRTPLCAEFPPYLNFIWKKKSKHSLIPDLTLQWTNVFLIFTVPVRLIHLFFPSSEIALNLVVTDMSLSVGKASAYSKNLSRTMKTFKFMKLQSYSISFTRALTLKLKLQKPKTISLWIIESRFVFWFIS